MPAEFGRLLTAMVTPMTATGEVDDAACAELARALVASGTEGIVATGTTGESPTLTPQEQVRVWRAVKAAVGKGVAVIAGSTNNNTALSIELSREAERAGVDGLLLTVPAYNKPTQEGLVRHFTAIAEATALPGLLYNVPGRTSLNMSADTTVRLAAVRHIVGVKEASGDLGQIARIIERAPRGFRVWSGNDSDTLPVLAVGGYGVVSVAAHVVGRQIAQMMADAVAGRAEAAAAIHRRLLPLVDALFVESNPIPTKCALNALGFPVGEPRLPLLPASAGAAERIRAELARQQIDLPLPVKR